MSLLRALAALSLASVALVSSAIAQSGYQTIQGTRVFTEIDQAARVARFSNDCGSQTLTQRELQNGAIPDDIIPCPRPRASEPPPLPRAPVSRPQPEPLTPPPDNSEQECIGLSRTLLRKIRSTTEHITVAQLRRSMVSLRQLCADGGRLELLQEVETAIRAAPVIDTSKKGRVAADKGASRAGSMCNLGAQCVELTNQPAGLCNAGGSLRQRNYAKLKNIMGCPSEATLSFTYPNGKLGTWEIDNKKRLMVDWSCGGSLVATGITYRCPMR